MQNTPNTTPAAAAQSTFPIPFTLEQLREDILNLYLLQLHNLSLFTNRKNGSQFGGVDVSALVGSSTSTRELGLNYEDIQDADFAKAMEQQYSYAFFGIDNRLSEPMQSETTHTWVAAYLTDLKTSATAEEREAYGATFDVRRCVHTCELANARKLLEGEGGFYTFDRAWGDEDNNSSERAEGALTIHQMALLSGMEEMSIRTAISRPSANQLSHFKEDRRTLIKIADAKEWLIAKGRYVQVSLLDKGGQALDLEKTSFNRPSDFAFAIASHVRFLTETQPLSDTRGKLDVLKSAGLDFFNRDCLLNPELMARAAVILCLPDTLFVLRGKESVLKQDLAEISRTLATERTKP